MRRPEIITLKCTVVLIGRAEFSDGHAYMLMSEQNLTIRELRSPGDKHRVVSFTHARESISHDDERKPSGPRIGQPRERNQHK